MRKTTKSSLIATIAHKRDTCAAAAGLMDHLLTSGQRLDGIGTDPEGQLVAMGMRESDAVRVGDDHE